MNAAWCDVCDQWPHAYDCPGQSAEKDVTHEWDTRCSGSGRGVCTCGWATGHYALASDPDLDWEFDEHLAETRVNPPEVGDE